MYIVGLTGISGSGKSYVCELLSKRFYTIDADKVYADITSGKSECMDELESKFGSAVVNKDGSLNRSAMRDIVFNNKKMLNQLNKIAHKHVLIRINELTEKIPKKYKCCIVDAPQLFESGYDKQCDLTVGIVSNTNDCIKRIIERDGITEEAAKTRIKNQHTVRYFKEKCDYVIDNKGSLEDLDNKVKELIMYINERI